MRRKITWNSRRFQQRWSRDEHEFRSGLGLNDAIGGWPHTYRMTSPYHSALRPTKFLFLSGLSLELAVDRNQGRATAAISGTAAR